MARPRKHFPAPQLAPSTPGVRVEMVEGREAREEFIRFHLRLFANEPHFVPPLIVERREFFDPLRNPFFEHAKAGFFLATKDGQTVGRVAAVFDERYNQFHQTHVGFVGVFDCVNDPGVASHLFKAAFDWLQPFHVKKIMGPVNLAFHHECGVLIDGFDRLPSIFSPYNHRYYARLFEVNGFRKMKDVSSFELFAAQALPEKVERLAQRVRRSGRVTLRSMEWGSASVDVRHIQEIYESMLQPGWGLAPLTAREMERSIRLIQPLIFFRPELSLMAEVGGEPVAFSITVPEANVALKAAQGRLSNFGLPIGLVKFAMAARKVDQLRMVLFGIKPGFRRRGIDALLADETLRRANQLGYRSAEVGWIAEDETLLNRLVETAGARRIKTYRIFDRVV